MSHGVSLVARRPVLRHPADRLDTWPWWYWSMNAPRLEVTVMGEKRIRRTQRLIYLAQLLLQRLSPDLR